MPVAAVEVGTVVRPGRVRNRTKTEPDEKVKKPADGVRKKSPPARKAPARGRYTDMTNPTQGLFRVNVDGTNTVHLLTYEQCHGCQSAAWSPQGNEIAVISNGYNEGVLRLLVVPATGCPWPNSSDPCPLVLYSEPWGGADHYFSGLAWSPDGAQLAMIASRGTENKSIVLVDRATGTVTDVFPFGGILSDWGRGERATTLAISASGGIYFYDLSTPHVPPQLIVPDAGRPSFSPDGRYIVYVEAKEPGSTVKRQLDTGMRTLLLRSGGINPDRANSTQALVNMPFGI